MPNNNKKVKKGRGKVLSLNSFLGDTPTGTVCKKISTNDYDEGDEDSPTEQIVLQLPTAPKANRLFDDDSIPHKPPFIARLSNLPFDGDEDDIHEFFGAIPIISLRLPREDGDTGRVRGFGNVEFDTRDDLIRALSMPDPTLKGRRIRIEMFNENDQQNNQRMNKRGYSGFGDSSTDRESTNWRRDGTSNSSSYNAAPSRSYGYNSGQRESSGWQQQQSAGASRDENASGNWRSDSRPSSGDFSSWRNKIDGERRRDNSTMEERNNYSSQAGNSSSWRNRNDNGRRGGYSDNEQQINQRPMDERPRLDIRPRTLPMPEIVVQEDASFRSTTPEETETAAMPTGSAQLESNRNENAEGGRRMIDEPEIARAEHAARPRENARMANINEGNAAAMPDEPEMPVAAAAAPNNLADERRFAAVLNIDDGPRNRQMHQENQRQPTNEGQNWRRCNQLNASLEADSGHDSDGAAGYDNRD